MPTLHGESCNKESWPTWMAHSPDLHTDRTATHTAAVKRNAPADQSANPWLRSKGPALLPSRILTLNMDRASRMPLAEAAVGEAAKGGAGTKRSSSVNLRGQLLHSRSPIANDVVDLSSAAYPEPAKRKVRTSTR